MCGCMGEARRMRRSTSMGGSGNKVTPSLHVWVRGRGHADAARHVQLQAVQIWHVQVRQLLAHALRQGVADARRQVTQRAQRVVRQPIALPAKPDPSKLWWVFYRNTWSVCPH